MTVPVPKAVAAKTTLVTVSRILPHTSTQSATATSSASQVTASSHSAAQAKATTSPAGVKRKDAPPVYNLTRGSKKVAMEGALDDAIFDNAMKSYVKDWASSGDTSEHYFVTWSSLHTAHWDGIRRPATGVLPLTPVKVHTIGCLLKLGGNRSAKNYLDVVKKKNAELGQWWTPDLELAGKRMVMSCQRGMGPPRQSDPLNYEAILMLDLGTEAIVPQGPINTKALAVMGTMFMTREIEIALAERSHITVDKKRKIIKWRLPVSKADPQAM